MNFLLRSSHSKLYTNFFTKSLSLIEESFSIVGPLSIPLSRKIRENSFSVGADSKVLPVLR